MNKKIKPENINNIVIYEDKQGNIELRADVSSETIWATQAQIAKLFNVNPQAVIKHLGNIYFEGELIKDSTCSILEQVKKEGNRVVKRQIEFYNLDAIIAVGYRVNSKKATQFRIWATKVLHEYLIRGYALNKYRINNSTESLEGLHEAIALIESKEYRGTLKGKITVKIMKNLVQK